MLPPETTKHSHVTFFVVFCILLLYLYIYTYRQTHRQTDTCISISRERKCAKFQGRSHACVLSNKGQSVDKTSDFHINLPSLEVTSFERMQELLTNNCDPCGVGFPSQWTGGGESFADQSTLSDNLSLKMGSSTPHQQNTKQVGFQFQFQDQDSSSTQSTSQSYPEVASAGDSCKYWEKISVQSAHGTHEDGSVGSALPIGTQDFAFATQPDHKHPYACIPLPYYHGMFAPYGYGSQTMLPHFQGMNITSTRVPLPPDFTQGEAIYVNAKQYSAILRRRQQRAKLEAQNKLLKPRKPYLHESRHVHALKRARGPGGRFLNLKKIQETQPGGSSNEQEDMDPASLETNHHGGSSDSTTASNIDNYFHQHELKFSIYNSHSDGPTQADGFGGTHHMFR